MPVPSEAREFFRRIGASKEAIDLERLRSFLKPEVICFAFMSGDGPVTESNLLFDDDAGAEFYDFTVQHVREFRVLSEDFFRACSESPSVRRFLVMWAFGCFMRPENFDVFLKPMLEQCPQAVIARELARLPKMAKRVVASLQTILTVVVTRDYTAVTKLSIKPLLELMKAIYTCLDSVGAKPHWSEMANDAIHCYFSCENMAEMILSDQMWTPKLLFTEYPFLFPMSFKVNVAKILVDHKRGELFGTVSFGSDGRPYLEFLFEMSVRRDHLFEDTMEILKRAPPESFLKFISVAFEGESGLDMGGVSREFFTLFGREITSPQLKMFVELNGFHWFSTEPVPIESAYSFLGRLVGLAICNDMVIPIRFPNVLYKMLVKQFEPTLINLAELEPEVAKSLQQLLTFTPEMIRECGLTFTKTAASGKEYELIPGGSQISVTSENVEKYVNAYVKWTLWTSVEGKYKQFEEGLLSVVSWPFMSGVFQYDECNVLVTGNPVADLSELRRVTDYDNYDANDVTVIHFWEFVEELSSEDQKKLLMFLFGTDRFVIGTQRFLIQRTADIDHFPVARTCANILLLPDYKDKEVLKKKMSICLEHCEGFGVI